MGLFAVYGLCAMAKTKKKKYNRNPLASTYPQELLQTVLNRVESVNSGLKNNNKPQRSAKIQARRIWA